MKKFNAGKASVLVLLAAFFVVALLLGKSFTVVHANEVHLDHTVFSPTPTPTPTPTKSSCDDHDCNHDHGKDDNCPKKSPTPTPTPTPTKNPCEDFSRDHDSHDDKRCASPSPSPSPSASPSATPAPTSTPGFTNDGGDGLGCAVHDCSGNYVAPPQGQVLGASTMAKTGSFEEVFYQAIMGIGATLSTFGLKGLKKVKKTSKK